jgi:hypothetical protein
VFYKKAKAFPRPSFEKNDPMKGKSAGEKVVRAIEEIVSLCPDSVFVVFP